MTYRELLGGVGGQVIALLWSPRAAPSGCAVVCAIRATMAIAVLRAAFSRRTGGERLC